jgi:hypothetical protein
MLLKTRGWIAVLVLAAGVGCGRLTDKEASRPPENTPFAPGRRYEDFEARIKYNGSWVHETKFPLTSSQSVSYSQKPGDNFQIAFTGSAITYIFTQAVNRGIAEVMIDGQPVDRISLYSLETVWQAKHRFGGLKPGTHTFEVRVSGEKDPHATGTYVDLDAFEVEP